MNNCFTQSCKTVAVGINSISKTHGFKIYPNPNNGSFTVEVENPGKEISIGVYNSLGQIVQRVEKVGKTTLFDLELSAGIYLVCVINRNEVWNKKVVISVGGTPTDK